MRFTSEFLAAVLPLFGALLSFTSSVSAGGVLAVDLGTESLKLSLVKPGVPFDVMLDRDSKRKLAAAVVVRGEDRFIGAEAAGLASRFPRDTFLSPGLLLGRSPASDTNGDLERYSTLGVAELDGSAASSRGAVSLRNAQGKIFLPEEVAAQLLNYARGLAEEVGKEKVYGAHDAVITVPPFYSQFERQAVIDALELGGLRNLGLITDGGAIAINFAIPRQFPTPETHIFYDAGAGSVRATAVRFHTREERIHPSSKTTVNVTDAIVLGAAWERKAGGLEMDYRLRELLRKEFEKGEGKSVGGGEGVKQIPRAMVKLLREAQRIKHVLTVNTEASVRIEGLAEDIDLRTVVTRDSFEEACADIQPLFVKPIQDVLVKAKLGWNDITSVNLVGGAVRVPFVQTAIKTVVPEGKVAQNLNADEAAVMGAALFGAGQSGSFKTKDIRLQELVQYSVKLSYTPEGGAATSTVLFDETSKAGEVKQLQIPRVTDFDIKFEHAENSGIPKELMTVTVAGLTNALTNLSEIETAANKTVTVTVGLSDSLVVAVKGAKLRMEGKPDAAAGGLFKGLFGSKKEENETAETKPPPKGLNKTIPLKITTNYHSIKPFMTEDRVQASKKLKDIDAAQRRKLLRGEARNALESLIYKLRDRVAHEDFVGASKKEERDTLSGLLDTTGEWLWDAAETADTKEFKAKQTEMEKITKKVAARIEEAKDRAVTVPLIALQLFEARNFVDAATANLTAAEAAGEPSKYTFEDLDALEKQLTETNAWWKETKEKVEKQAADEDVPLTLKTSELRRRVSEVQNEVRRLSNRRAPKKKKVTSSSAPPAAEGTAAASPAEEAKAPTASGEGEPVAQATPTADEGAHKKDEL